MLEKAWEAEGLFDGGLKRDWLNHGGRMKHLWGTGGVVDNQFILEVDPKPLVQPHHLAKVGL